MVKYDVLQRFVVENTEVRGEIVRLKETFRSAAQYVDYPPEIRQLLGEALSAAALLCATLKFSGKLSLQLQGDGQISLLLVQVTHDRKIRGLIQWSGAAEKLTFRQMIGNAQFAITIEPDQGNRYQGIVPISGESLGDCLESYFRQSEQLPTGIRLAADEETAAGFLLQRLPGHETKQAQEEWEHLTILAKTITDQELLSLPSEDLLYRLYHGEEVRLYDPQPVDFFCSCSKQRCENAILSLGKDEIRELAADSTSLTMNCEFCGAPYSISHDDLLNLLDVAEKNRDSRH